jgi:[lysine-biosynthesis-protein LysW]---L-2-aminoadipate ligase
VAVRSAGPTVRAIAMTVPPPAAADQPPLPIAVLASRVRLEEKQILAELERRRVPHTHIDTRRIQLDVTEPPIGRNRGFASRRFSVVLSREISHTRALYAARLLGAMHVPVVNSAETIEVCGDKLLTSLRLVQAGLPTPRTALALTPEAGLRAIKRIGYPAVLKPLTGSWGRLVALVKDEEAARAVLEHRDALGSPQHQIIYVQELVDKPDRDIRVIVVGDQVLGATYRRSRDWRTNVSRGAASVPCPVSGELLELTLGAAKAVGGGVLGVDLIEGQGGKLSVLEVNHNLEFAGFQAAHQGRVDVAGAIVEYLIGLSRSGGVPAA